MFAADGDGPSVFRNFRLLAGDMRQLGFHLIVIVFLSGISVMV
jgi:hypothetical protein